MCKYTVIQQVAAPGRGKMSYLLHALSSKKIATITRRLGNIQTGKIRG